MISFGKKKYNLGIAMGGGGARGFAHLGVMEALAEKGIKPDIISGVSAGAIAGAFIASGQSPRDAFDLMKKYNFTGLAKLTGFKQGLLSLTKMKEDLEKKIKAKNLEDLDIPLIVTVSNMLEGKVEYLSEGPLSTIVQASASIPIIFSPVEYQGKLYNDGGLFDNLPIKPLQDNCKKIISISISPIQKLDELKNLKEVVFRMFQLAINTSSEEIAANSDLCIEPLELANYDIMDTKNAEKIFEIGYNYAKNLDIKL
ncbi:patatin-like phospholipase family protein [Ekhidna sp.]